MKTTLAERAQKILDDKEITQVELANLAGCTKGAINQWFKSSKADSEMAPRYAYAIADKTDYEPRWLMIGEGPIHRSDKEIEGLRYQPAVAEPESSYKKRLSPGALAIAEYYDGLPDHIRFEFRTSMTMAFMKIRLEHPDVDLGNIADLLNIVK